MSVASFEPRPGVALVISLALVACGESFSSDAGPTNQDQDSALDGAIGSGGGGGIDSAAEGSAGGGDSEPEPAIPTQGLLLWLRADQGVTEESGQVTSWADQSGSRSDATQTAPDARPKLVSSGIGNRPSIEFDGMDDFMKLPAGFADFGLGVTLFATIQQEPTNACAAVLELSNGSEIDDISFGQFQSRLLYEVFDQFHSGDELPIGTPQIIAVVHRPDLGVQMRENGRPAGESSFPLPAVIVRQLNFVGRSLYAGCVVFAGRIAEVLVYDRAVSDAELLVIEEYLRGHAGCCTN